MASHLDGLIKQRQPVLFQSHLWKLSRSAWVFWCRVCYKFHYIPGSHQRTSVLWTWSCGVGH